MIQSGSGKRVREVVILAAFLMCLVNAGEASGASAPTSDWRQDRPCTQIAGQHRLDAAPPRVETPHAGCPGVAYCVTSPNTPVRVCYCADSSTASAFSPARITVERQGGSVFEVTGNSYQLEPEEMELLVGDLDGDGYPETIVLIGGASSNGIALEDWQAVLFDGRDLGRPPVYFGVAEYGRHGTFLASPTTGQCRILVTNWETDTEPGRRPGLYLVGRWYRYRAGHLIPDVARPQLMRRYLFSFGGERHESSARAEWWDADRPFHFFLSPKTITRPFRPSKDPRLIGDPRLLPPSFP